MPEWPHNNALKLTRPAYEWSLAAYRSVIQTTMNLDDPRWPQLRGGYRVPTDVRPLLRQLESGEDPAGAWTALWDELHHQGDVGEASYAAVPHLVRIHRQRGVVDWNTYAMVATVELLRGRGSNPEVPSWLKEQYSRSLVELAQIGLRELPEAEGEDAIRCILAVIALWKGARTYSRLLSDFSEEEVLELEKAAFGEGAG
jgi:hypothetical protein